jgi:hypothetical protein
VEPAEAINVVESVLRQAITQALGTAWTNDLVVAQLEERRTEEAKRRNGAVVDDDLLAYTHLYELLEIIKKQWPQFKPIFKDQKRFEVYLKRLEDFRNAPMHSRTLLPFERDLLSGIAGELRNSLTLWRSQQAPDMSWYPNVDSITDSLGNTLDITADNVRVPARLQVGDVLKFRCIAWDPQDRELTWTLHADAHIGPELDRQVGSEVTLGWNITEANVAETSIVVIQMRSDGRYHRLPWGVDISITTLYAVDPPA